MLRASLTKCWLHLKHFFDFKAKRRRLYQMWEQQAQAGKVEACYKLLMLYYEEKPEYYPLAFKWTVAVANRGEDCGVMLQAAEMYLAGKGVAPDAKRALLWFERALSTHILQGRRSPLSVHSANYIQERIQELRAQVGDVPL